MNLVEAMQKRISLRDFTDYMPSKEEIDAILEAIYYAPTVFMTKNAHISVITDKAVLKQLDELGVSRYAKPLNISSVLYNAPVYIVISAPLVSEVPEAFRDAIDLDFCNRSLAWTIGTMVQNIQLRATDLGLASCPVNGTVAGLIHDKDLSQKIGIPQGYTPLTSVVIGKSKTPYEVREARKDNYIVSFV
ncbi:nitroreductase family protein [Campylobacter majalis]|uniref:nitroreductase family protein n=1 Tax=Campylobacter majalis TaxID=2790656 RepID=UPI003D695862